LAVWLIAERGNGKIRHKDSGLAINRDSKILRNNSDNNNTMKNSSVDETINSAVKTSKFKIKQ